VNEVLRRLVDVTDPAAPLGYTDLGALVADVGCLFGYEARRRRIEVAPVEGHAGPVRTRCDPGHVGRLVFAMYGRALAFTPDGGRFGARAETRGSEVAVAVEHTTDDSAGGLRYETESLAAGARALGGRLERTGGEQRAERLVLVVPGNE
jgi:hypothetical protein